MKASLRTAISSFLIGALSIGLAWAGAGVAPVDVPDPTDLDVPGAPASQDAAPAQAQAKPGQVLAGAAKVSIEPRPADYDGEWAKEGCATFGDDALEGLSHVPDFRVKWPENPNCLYMGGYGIGPMNPITTWTDPYGLWVRSVAVSDGSETVVLTILDGVYYFGEYRDMCEDCGFFDLAAELGEELEVDPSGFLFASTHSHTSPDFIGGWGGVPDWYFRQVADAIRTSVRQAVGSLKPAVVEMGEALARPFNAERRDFYRSAEESQLAWFRVLRTKNGKPCTSCSAIATVGSFAAHPVTADETTGIADGDFPGVFNQRVEERFGGVGLFFQTGLGNLSPRGDKVELGGGLAALVPKRGAGAMISEPDVRAAQTFWDQPVTNSGLTALGLPGFFDRPFQQTPSSVQAGKNANKPCSSASGVTVRTAVSAARIGPLLITGAPGEIFANFSNTVAEKNPHGVTMALALVNDGLGYIMQSFETDHVGRQGTGFVLGGSAVEYEDAYSIDACFGDMALETTLGLIGQL